MATFTLPKNSKIRKTGEVYEALTGGTTGSFKVYRYDPDSGENPRYDTFNIDLDECGPMVRCADKSEVGAGQHTHLPPLLPRRDLRFVRDEYQR